MSLQEFTRDDIIRRIRTDNPWWQEGSSIQDFYARLMPRPYIDSITDFLLKPIKRSLVLLGPRRVGKTVLLQHTIQYLLSKGKSGTGILFLSLDAPIYSGIPIENLIGIVEDDNFFSGERYLFLDEVQYHENWAQHIKALTDARPDLRVVVSGSAAAALKLRSRESGAGRFTDFYLPPLTFYEYLKLAKEMETFHFLGERTQNDSEKFSAAYQKLKFYVQYGGFPELALNPSIQKDARQFVKNDIIEKVLLKDLPSLYGIDNVQELNQLFTMLAYNTGREINLESLSKNSQGITKPTIRKYLKYLESAFLIQTLPKVDDFGKKFRRASSFKIYLRNPSMRTALFGEIPESDGASWGNLMETSFFSQLTDFSDSYYASGKKVEVDYVELNHLGKISFAAEIKSSNRVFENPGEIVAHLEFARAHKLDSIVVTTKTEWSNRLIQGVIVCYRPLAQFIFQAGELAVHQQQRKLASLNTAT